MEQKSFDLITLDASFKRWEDARHRIFIHIPRTAGTSLGKALGGYHLTHWPISEIRRRLGARYSEYKSFAVVRNTWDRLVSLFKFDGRIKAASKRASKMSFKEFIRNVDKQPWSISQLFFLCDGDTSLDMSRFTTNIFWNLQDQYGEIIVDKILRFETLDEDMKQIDCGVLETLNTTVHRHYSSFYSPELRDIVQHKYHDEIERFGFTFEMKEEGIS